jgi:hypothetical protein
MAVLGGGVKFDDRFEKYKCSSSLTLFYGSNLQTFSLVYFKALILVILRSNPFFVAHCSGHNFYVKKPDVEKTSL